MVNVDELIAQHKKVISDAKRKCKKCGADTKNMGIRMSMSINYRVHKCIKCGEEELEYVGEAD